MELRFLPNREGYRFWGETYDGELVACVVKRGPSGTDLVPASRVDGTVRRAASGSAG